MTTRTVVAATDGSHESIQAVEWAAREARLHNAPLRIVSAAEMLPRMTAPPHAISLETVVDALRANRDHALTAAAKAAAAIAPGLLIDTDPLDGPPAQAVTHSGTGALMLVTGSKGSGAFSAMILGSVSRYAALHASCPVVVVREETMATHRQVIVGIRHPDDCDAALGFAFEEAALRDASLLAVHAWQSPYPAYPPYPDGTASPDGHNAVEAHAATELERLLNAWREKYPGVVTRHDVVRGHPGHMLAGLSARADLVVLGRHPHGRAVPGPSRIVQAMLSHAHGPVVAVPSA